MKSIKVLINAELNVNSERSSWDGKVKVGYNARITVLGEEVGSSDFRTYYKTEKAAVAAAKRDFKSRQ